MSYITDTDISYVDASIETLRLNVNSSLNGIWVELGYDDVSLNQIWDLMATNASVNNGLSQKLDNTTDTFRGVLTVDGCMYLIGNFYQNGSTYTVNAENLNTNADFITMRANAVLQIPDGSISGIRVVKADGTNDVILGTANDAIMRIGWNGDTLEAIATREDAPVNNWYAYWDDGSTMFKTYDLKAYIDNKATQLSVHAWAGNTGGLTIAKSTTRYAAPVSTTGIELSDVPAKTRNIVWHNATIRDLAVRTNGNPGAVDNTVMVTKNGLDTSLYTILNNVETGDSSTRSFVAAKYDELGIKISTGNGNVVPWSWAFEIVYILDE